MTLRVIETGLAGARWNIAVSAALIDLHRARRIPDTLRLYRYERSVLLGLHQDVHSAISPERCRARGVAIARRVTGGGAVYMSPGILTFEIVASRLRFSSVDEVSKQVGNAIVRVLGDLGIVNARVAANAVLVDGQKICGMAGSLDGGSLILQGTLVIELDRDELGDVLAPSYRQEVTSLAEVLGTSPSLETIISLLRNEIGTLWSNELIRGELNPEEHAVAQNLCDREMGTDEFVMGEQGLAEARA